MEYKDERICMHLFSSTLDDLPNKRYKMEEARGETFLWNELKQNFIKELKFISEYDELLEAMKQIKTFIKPTVSSSSTGNHNRLKASCHSIRLTKVPKSTRLRL